MAIIRVFHSAWQISIGLLLIPICIKATSYNWIGTSGGNWNNTADWSPTGFPHLQGDEATFDLTGLQTITVNTTGINVGGITIDGTANCTIAGSTTNFLTFSVPSGTAALNVSNNATNTISSPMTLSSPLSISNSSSGPLTLSGKITAAGSNSMTYSGPGTLNLNNSTNLSSFTSGLNITGGTTIVTNLSSLGSGTITLSGSGILELNQSAFSLSPAINCNGTGVLYTNSGAVTLNSAIEGSGNLILCSGGVNGYFILTQPSSFSGIIGIGYGDTLGSGSGGVSISAVNQLGSGLTGINAMIDSSQSRLIVTQSGLNIGVPLSIISTDTSQTTFFIYVPQGDTFTYSGNISGNAAGGLRCSVGNPQGGGTLVLSGNNTDFIGGIILSGSDSTLYPTLSVSSAENIGSTTIEPISGSYSIRTETFAGMNFTGNVVCTPTMPFQMNGTVLLNLGFGTVSSIASTVTSPSIPKPLFLNIIGPGDLYFTGDSSSTWIATEGIAMSDGATLGVSYNSSFGTDQTSNVITLNNGNFKILGSAYGGTGVQSVNRPLDLTGAGSILLDDETTSSWGGGLNGSDPLTIAPSSGMTGTGVIAFSSDSSASYTGQITIDTVTVQISNDDNLGSDTTLTMDEGTLEFTASVSSPREIILDGLCTLLADSGTDNILSGSLVNGTSTGSLIVGNSGTIELTAANNYSGSTTIKGGTLALGGSGTIADSSSLTLVNSGTAFDISALSTGTEVNNLSTVAGSTINLGSNVLSINQTVNGTASGDITGSGGLTLTGPSSLTLIGVKNYTGNTLIENGALYVNGDISSSSLTTVEAGTLLGGTGRLNNISVFGTLSPGNSIGTITGHEITFEPGSTYDVELIGSSSDLIDATTISILPGSTLSIFPESPTESVYIIAMASSGVNGTFSNVIYTPMARYNFIPLYTPNEILLEISMNDFVDFFTKGNLRNIAACFDGMIQDKTIHSGQNSVLNVLNSLTIPGIVDAFNQFDPSVLGTINFAELDSSLGLLNFYSGHMSRFRTFNMCFNGNDCDRQNTVWIAPYGFKEERNSSSEELMAYSGFTHKALGVVSGWDYELRRNFYVSVGLSYAKNWMEWKKTSHVHADFDAISGLVSASFATPRFFLNANFVGTYNSVSANRKIYVASPFAIPPIDYDLKNHNNSYTLASALSLAWNVYSCGTNIFFSLWPYLNANYVFLHQFSYKETGGGVLNMSMHSRNLDVLLPEGGFCFSFEGQPCGFCAYTNVWLGYSQEVRFQGQLMEANFRDLPGCTIALKGLYPRKGFFTPRVDLGVQDLCGGLELLLTYKGFISSASSSTNSAWKVAFGFKFCQTTMELNC